MFRPQVPSAASQAANCIRQRVEWRDLLPLTTGERFRELLRPLWWLSLALALLPTGWWALGLVAAAYFFLAGLRLVHDVFHGNLGLPQWANRAILTIMSGLMLGSMHAVRLTHLHHHRHCLGPDDVEGSTARHSALRALLLGPLFPVRLHLAAVRLASRTERRWMALDVGVALLAVASAALASVGAYQRFVAAMFAAQMVVGFFAVWTVHHDCHEAAPIARTLRHRFKSRLVLDMFYHLEHHWFPRVPTCRLPTLADRIDHTVPDLERRWVC